MLRMNILVRKRATATIILSARELFVKEVHMVLASYTGLNGSFSMERTIVRKNIKVAHVKDWK